MNHQDGHGATSGDSKMKNQEVIQDCRKAARDNGMTFKKSDDFSSLYNYVVRRSNVVVIKNMSLSQAFERACSGELANYDHEEGHFINPNID